MKLEGKTKAECLALIKTIEEDPNSKSPPGQLWIYTKKARDKMEKIRRHIVSLQIEERKAAGTYVAPDGYSGRQSNRRR